MKLISLLTHILVGALFCSTNQVVAAQAGDPVHGIIEEKLIESYLSRFKSSLNDMGTDTRRSVCRELAIKIAPQLKTKDQLELFIKNYLVAHPCAARHRKDAGYLEIQYEVYFPEEAFFDTLLYYIIEEIGKDETTRSARYHAIFESELIQACAFISYGIHCPSRVPATISRYFPQQNITTPEQASSLRHNAFLQWQEQTRRKSFCRTTHSFIKYTVYALACVAALYGSYYLYKYV